MSAICGMQSISVRVDHATYLQQQGTIVTHRPIHDANLPKPVGPYSPGMGFERLIFVSGQGATDPTTGKLAGSDASAQTEQCLRNVRTILRAAGSDLSHVLRCGVFLLDMDEYAAPQQDRKSTRLNSSHSVTSRMPSSA